MPHRARRLPVAVAAALLVAGCAPTGPQTSSEPPAPDALAGVVVEVAQSETCGCCGEWVDHLERHGAVVEVAYAEDMAAVKAAAGVPDGYYSCHTATIDGYVVEGHLPVQAIVDLLDTAPAIDGIALPGMPPGSPGMPGEQEAPFEVATFVDGEIGSFGAY